MSWVSIVESQVFLVYGLCSELHRPIKFVRVSIFLQGIRQGNHMGYLIHRIPLIDQMQRLVVDILVHVALRLKRFNHSLVTEPRPVVRDKHNLGLSSIEPACLVQIP